MDLTQVQDPKHVQDPACSCGQKAVQNCRHSSSYAVNVRAREKTAKPHKLRLLTSTKGEKNRVEL